MHQKRNVANTRNNEREQRTSKDEACEGGRDDKTGCNEIVTRKVFLDIPPWAFVRLGLVKGPQRQSVNGLTRSVGKDDALPTYILAKIRTNE